MEVLEKYYCGLLCCQTILATEKPQLGRPNFLLNLIYFEKADVTKLGKTFTCATT